MFNWMDYLKLSKAWKSIDSSDPLHEAYHRSAISRAYYFTYHNAKNFAIKNGFTEDPNRQGDRHKEIIEYLNNNNKIRAGNFLHKLRKNRNSSDYDSCSNIDQRLLNTSLSYVTFVIDDII